MVQPIIRCWWHLRLNFSNIFPPNHTSIQKMLPEWDIIFLKASSIHIILEESSPNSKQLRTITKAWRMKTVMFFFFHFLEEKKIVLEISIWWKDIYFCFFPAGDLILTRNFKQTFHAFGLWLKDMAILDDKLHLPSLAPNMLPDLLIQVFQPSKKVDLSFMDPEELARLVKINSSEWRRLHFRNSNDSSICK